VCLLDISQATGADWLVSVWTPFTYWSYFTHPFPVYWLSYPRNIIPPDHLLSSIHIKETVCTYLCTYMSLFHMQTARPTYTKFCTDLHTNSGRFLTQVWPCRPNSLTLPTQFPDPVVPQASKPKQITEEKNFAFQKMSRLVT